MAFHHTSTDSMFEYTSVKAGTTATVKFLIDYTRVFVPKASYVDNVHGHFLLNDWISVTFVLNEGMPLLDEATPSDAFAPLVCLYRVLANHGDPVFQGCYTGVTTLLPRQDSPDSAFVEESEVYFASRIIVQLVRDAGSLPTYDLSVVSNDYCEDSSWEDEDEDHRESHTLVTVKLKWYVPTYKDRIFGEYHMLQQSPYTMNTSVHFFRPLVALNTYFKAFVSRDYPSFRRFLAPDMTFEVVGLTNYTTAELVYYYQLLADWQISDVIKINGIAMERMYQQGHTVVMQVMMLSVYLHTPLPLAIWNNKYMVHVQFDRYANITRFVQHVNLLDAFIRRPPVAQVNISAVCEEIQTICTDDIIVEQFLPAQVGAVQYANVSSCIAYLESIPLLGPTPATQTSGKSVSCVYWHLLLARSNAPHHCIHVGHLKIDPTKTPCQDF